MSRNAVAVVSSAVFVALAALLVIVSVPYVAWRPGQTIDVLASGESGSAISISGVPTYDTTGKLLMTTVSTTRVDSSLSLPEAIFVYLRGDSDAMPRELIYQPGLTRDQVEKQAVKMMDTSRINASVAALRAFGGVAVTEMPMVESVALSGPSDGKLQPGDLIKAVGLKDVVTAQEVKDQISNAGIGDDVEFTIQRDGEDMDVIVRLAASRSEPVTAEAGITIGVGFSYAPGISYGIDQGVTGPSAGLIFALGVYDKLTQGSLVGNRVIAGTGTIDANGRVGPIGGVREKIKGAERDGASFFLLPEGNCDNVEGLSTDVQLIKVSELNDAIAALKTIERGAPESLPSCG